MKIIKILAILFLLLVFFQMGVQARAVRVLDMKELIKGSELVFVGRVKSVSPSDITTELTYPTWRGVVFQWLKVEVEVVEPVKGTKKGEIVRTLMLSARDNAPMVNAPGMVEPKVGQRHLLCLLPTTLTGAYAAVTAPFDDDQSIFLLDRTRWAGAAYYKDGKEVAFHEQSERNRVLWRLVDDNGEINRDEAEDLRKRYTAEIATPASKDAVIHLQWKRATSASGWQWNVPNDGSSGVEGKKANESDGPVTRP